MSNTNNINPILEAAGELDNSVIENAFKPKRKKPVALIVIAAAVVVSLLVGFTTTYRMPVYHNGKELFGITEVAHPDAVIPSIEELTAMGAYDIEKWSGQYTYYIKAKPSEIIRKYNLTPLINDNFSDEVTINDIPDDTNLFKLSYFYSEEDNLKLLPGTEVTVGDKENYVNFKYFLVDKQNGLPICVRVTYTIHKVIPFGFQAFNGDDIRVIDLNTGEKAVIHGSSDSAIASFGYHGVSYFITGQTDVDGMNQILKDLGITDE